MPSSPEEFSDDALEDIAYLARSGSRLRVLAALATESYTRAELEEKTGVARTTVGRIINEFEERGWVRRTTDGEYEVTPLGKYVVSEFRPFVESIDAIRNLGNLVAWLPTDEVPISLDNFTDAVVRRPDPANPMSTVADFNTRLDGVSEFQCLVGIAPPILFEQRMRDAVVNRDLDTKHVITDEELNYLLDHPERWTRWREYLDAGANVYQYDGRVPCNLFVFDDTVIISNSQSDYGEPHVSIESVNDAVLSWAHEVIEKYKNEAERLNSAVFTDE